MLGKQYNMMLGALHGTYTVLRGEPRAVLYNPCHEFVKSLFPTSTGAVVTTYNGMVVRGVWVFACARCMCCLRGYLHDITRRITCDIQLTCCRVGWFPRRAHMHTRRCCPII